jgi:cell division protein FtsB
MSAGSVAHRRHPHAARVRWDRLGRIAIGLVALALVYLYVSAGIRMLSTWSQARGDSAAVATLERENAQLTREHDALGRRGTLEEEARELDMSKRGELPYLISGLPNN